MVLAATCGEIWWYFWRGEKRGKFAQIMVIVNFVMLIVKKKNVVMFNAGHVMSLLLHD
jgi:hypothetical protein